MTDPHAPAPLSDETRIGLLGDSITALAIRYQNELTGHGAMVVNFDTPEEWALDFGPWLARELQATLKIPALVAPPTRAAPSADELHDFGLALGAYGSEIIAQQKAEDAGLGYDAQKVMPLRAEVLRLYAEREAITVRSLVAVRQAVDAVAPRLSAEEATVLAALHRDGCHSKSEVVLMRALDRLTGPDAGAPT